MSLNGYTSIIFKNGFALKLYRLDSVAALLGANRCL